MTTNIFDYSHLPASPKDVDLACDLAELERIKAGWISNARVAQIPEKLYDIAFFLGYDQPQRRVDMFRKTTIDGMTVNASLEQGLYFPNTEEWCFHKKTWVDVTLPLGTVRLADWHWTFYSKDIRDEPENKYEEEVDSLYVPGSWIIGVLAQYPDAENVRETEKAYRDRVRAEALASRLLVGMDI